MYPDLSYLFHDLLGTAPDNWLSIFKTFGFMLAMAFLASALTFRTELRRKAREGFFKSEVARTIIGAPASWSDIMINAVAGLIFAGKGYYAYQHFDAFRRDPASVILSGKMHWPAAFAGALVLGGLIWFDSYRKRNQKPEERTIHIWPHDRVMDMTVWAAIGGIVGAKLFDAFDHWSDFLRDPLGTLLSGGGLAFYGGLILGFVAVVAYLMRHKIPFLPAADAAAPTLTVGYGVGRIGCQLSGDGDWGLPNLAAKPGWLSWAPDWIWSYRYPHNILDRSYNFDNPPNPNVPIEGCEWDYCMQLAQPVWPTPFYETMMMAVIFGVLWYLGRKIKAPGFVFFLYLGLAGIERFLIEKIRVNVKYENFFNLTQAEIIAIAMVIISAAGMVYAWKKYQN